MDRPLVLGASGPGFDSRGLAGGFVALLILALVRLLSDAPTRAGAKEVRVNSKKIDKVVRRKYGSTRRFWQYALETVWAAGAGFLGSPLAT